MPSCSRTRVKPSPHHPSGDLSDPRVTHDVVLTVDDFGNVERLCHHRLPPGG